MIERYCDGCGNRMKDQNIQPSVKHTIVRPNGEYAEVEVKITRAVNGAWNGDDLCIECIRDTVADGVWQVAQDSA